MGLLSRFGKSQKSSSSAPGFDSNFDVGNTSINGQQYNWGSYMRGDFSGFKKVTPEEVEAAEFTAQEMTKQVGLYSRKNQAETQSLESVRRIHNTEQVHTRKRLDEVVQARGQAVKTQEHLAEKTKPALHEQNERLGLAQEKGERKIAMISEHFERRRSDLEKLRSNWG